jgi:archaellum component FlaC
MNHLNNLLTLLGELLPLWVVLLLVGFWYLVFLVKKVSDRFIQVAEKQTDYLKDRVDVVDKSTGIFTRTIEQQEKEIARLMEQVTNLGRDLQNARETDARLSVQELKVLSSHFERLSAAQEELRSQIADAKGLVEHESVHIRSAIQSDLPRAIRARDLSIYSVLLSPINNAIALARELQNAGYAASVYTETTKGGMKEDRAAIWLGAAIPPEVAVDIMTIAWRRWRFLKYVHLSSDSVGPEYTHTQVYLGGSSQSAIHYGCKEWTAKDFAGLRSNMTAKALHDYVREKYGH